MSVTSENSTTSADWPLTTEFAWSPEAPYDWVNFTCAPAGVFWKAAINFTYAGCGVE